ncbi:protein eyes shut homolog isoform X3 [Topomyia yanbarensis]|uniref:protein eyes shut homolog isoform X3 n=1 Tax=Topomyia yanbarensis TaxID=2498891 RepID=UPI00273A8F4F|nr:protein eyes shut homolog isoform X3 [Topomyia yanbarensis]
MRWNINIVFLLVILSNLNLSAAIFCYKCENCPQISDSVPTEDCTSCAVWKNSEGSVDRGCSPEGSLDVVLICVSGGCNNQRFPVCQRCSDLDNCEMVMCEVNNKCFLNTEDDRRGCTSDSDYLENPEAFEVCEEDECNKVPECVVCNSDTDLDCLTNTERYHQKCARHGLYRDNNCYRQEVSDTEFRLGCTSEENAPDCTSDDCKTCATEYCNKKEFLTCYVCDENVADCRSINPEDHTLDRCTEYYDKCYLAYDRSKKTVRGCAEGYDPEDLFNTVDWCDTPKCNWAEFPTHLQCHQCQYCQESGPSDYCGKVSAEQCFTLHLEGGAVHRGCDTDEHFKDCIVGENCEACPSDRCNAEPIAEANTCYQCSDCELLTGITPEICIGSAFEGCYTMQDLVDNSISRGCVGDNTPDHCDRDNCRICLTDNCNTDEVMSEPLLCSSCSGTGCSEYSPVKECPSVGLLIDLCVTFAVLGVPSFKGCLSDGIPADLKQECFTNGMFCDMCDYNYCNTPPLKCYKCSSNADGAKCLTNPAFKESVQCESGDTCLTYLDENGHLHRGCSGDIGETCPLGSQCQHCTSPECNKHILPEDRQHCYQCSGENCITDDAVNQLEAEPCLVYHEGESCYTYVENESTVRRGCVSDYALCEDNPLCIPCSNENGCNSQNYMVSNELSCVKCLTSAQCEGNAFGSNCEKQILLGRTDACYIQYWLGLEVQKGCLSDLSDSHSCSDSSLVNNDECSFCFEFDCNRGPSICYQCNSEHDMDCSEVVGRQYLTECEGECVSFINKDGYTVRGCIESFSSNEIECDDSEQCEICKHKECNSAVLPVDRLKCYQCEGSQLDCLNPLNSHSYACRRYSESDRCFTYFENTTWVTRGCLSDKDDNTCTNECIPCGSTGCNKQEALQPNALSCITCQGTECDGESEGTVCTEKILLGRQDYCYSYEDGPKLQKGCLSDLKADDEVTFNCHDNESGKCALCGNDNCNGDFYYCVACNSAENPECGGSMNVVPPDMIEDCPERQCVSYIDENYLTTKGCATRTNTCEDLQTVDCMQCSGSMCNNVAFPEDRIMCYQCDDCDMLPSTQQATACEKYNPEEFCFTYVIDNIIHRGCLSQTSLSCDPSSSTCLSCTNTGCNGQPKEFDSTLSCVQCHGFSNCTYTTESTPCEGTVVLGNEDMCYSAWHNGELLQKGCLRKAASACDHPATCEFCSCDGCNLVTSDSPDIPCLVCEGDGCGDKLELSSDQICNDKACVSFMSQAGVVSRGCLFHFEEKCASYGNKHEVCTETRCNSELYPSDRIKCHRCTNCPDVFGEPEICTKYVEDDGCFTLISNDGASMKRGCLSELQSECNEPNCTPCYIDGCNDKTTDETTTFSTTDSSSDTTTESSSSTAETTTISSTDSSSESTSTDSSTSDAETTTLSSTDISSDSTPETTTLSPTDSSSDGTTSESITEVSTTPGSQACIRCEESISDPSCAWGFRVAAAEQCSSEGDIGCFSCTNNDLTIRGCRSDSVLGSCSDGTLETCSGSGCNNQNRKEQHCAICGKDCDGSKSYTVQKCSGIIEYANRGCYTLRNDRLTVITERGCVSTLTDDTRKVCDSPGDKCVICYDDGCNEGATVRVLKKLIVVAIAFLALKVKYI